MDLKGIKEKIEQTKTENLKLYFIVRKLKDQFKKRDRVMDKYDFFTFHVDVDDQIREYLYDTTIALIERTSLKNYDMADYDVISDDSDKLFTYPTENKVLSFMDVITNQLPNDPQKINNIESLITDNQELWAYCLGFEDTNLNKWIYTFRKMLKSKVVIDEKDNKKGLFKSLRTSFNTKSLKLEPIIGETINLDSQIDCIFDDDTFFIVKKASFEQILGLEEEYKVEAKSVVDELKKTGMINGLDNLLLKIESHPPIHKKLVRISRIGNYRDIDDKVIKKMQRVCKKYNIKLNVQDGKLCIENEEDVDIILKMLADYYKTGDVSGKPYGTFAGKEVEKTE